MSRTLKKKKHWSSKVQECAVSWGSLGEFGNVVEVLGGAEHGEFPYLGQMKLDVMVCHVGRMPYFGDVLLEINGTPISGLTNRDTHAVIRHFREPIRLKTVKPDWMCVVAWDMYIPVSIPVGGQVKLDSHSGEDVYMDSRKGLGDRSWRNSSIDRSSIM